MNKQEVIDEIKKIQANAVSRSHVSPHPLYADGVADTCSDVIKFLEQLDEPQKVKVPKLVAEWIELCKEKADLSSCLNGYYEIGDGTIVRPRGLSETFYDWLSDYDHMHDLARAYLDGYEVEEEPKWVVKSNRLYFTGITQLTAREPITYNFTTDEKRAHVFDDKESAEKEASFFDGTVEKVEE